MSSCGCNSSTKTKGTMAKCNPDKSRKCGKACLSWKKNCKIDPAANKPADPDKPKGGKNCNPAKSRKCGKACLTWKKTCKIDPTANKPAEDGAAKTTEKKTTEKKKGGKATKPPVTKEADEKQKQLDLATKYTKEAFKLRGPNRGDAGGCEERRKLLGKAQFHLALASGEKTEMIRDETGKWVTITPTGQAETGAFCTRDKKTGKVTCT